jgi:hypothetical protein
MLGPKYLYMRRVGNLRASYYLRSTWLAQYDLLKERKESMNSNRLAATISATLLLLSLITLPVFAAGKAQTLTGKVSDAMCGAKHEESAKPADCTRACAKHGANYVLVVGDKVYTLQTSDQAALDSLSKLAGANAKVSGDVDGTTVNVKSVKAGS